MWKILRKKSKRQKNNFSKKKIFNTFLFGIIGVALVVYIAQSNNLATKGYEIKDIEHKIEELKKSKRDLESKSLELQSLSTLTEKLKNLEMVESKEAVYLYQNSKTALKR